MINNSTMVSKVIAVIMIVICDVLAIQSLKYHKINDDIKYYCLACIIYGLLLSYFIYRSLHLSSVTVITFAWFSLAALINIIVGVYLYNEELNNNRLLGIMIMFIGVYIVYSSEK